VKTLSQKLIIIDILLSHVKLNKMSMDTSLAEQKRVLQKIDAKRLVLGRFEHFLAEWGLD
jgi:hypothetical protein